MKALNNPFDDRTRKQFDAYTTERQYLHVSCCFKVQGDCNEVVHNIDSCVASLSLRFQEDMRMKAFAYISHILDCQILSDGVNHEHDMRIFHRDTFFCKKR